MKYVTHLALLALTFTLAACSSQPDYRAARDGGYGYSETKLTDTQYRVSFKARGTDKSQAMNYAMLRAAEVTLQEDYDWFLVVHRDTLIDRERVPNPYPNYLTSHDMVTYCSAAGCFVRSYPRTAFSAGIHLGGRVDSDIEVVLEIKMGAGPIPDTDYSFNAEEVVKNLRPKTEEE
ncbi:hypothetical protein IDSA_09335 [Pseudidiomarina salinarum]|uniref:Lipoprotein n=1 Tax=Pseudidiomarina salinarum TaxID=435908 RepID=A0A094ISP8_9GAMM|nr:hypothetical protein [Pseudidiomarina salinarum]KFZ30715.1 hypothetical protein IDSA_09335 [Pseudidiomarina salinarum]RUO69234.1 hypothetical protein CWI79_10030 [Pseudidiomarina salinarum]